MPFPSSSLSTLRPDLAGSLMEFNTAMDRQGFIALKVLPVLEVAVQAGVFGKIPLEQLLQSPETVRAPGGGYNRGNWKFGTDSFACVEHGWEEPVDDREAKMYANYFDAEMVSAERALDFVLRAQEIRAASLIFNTTTWTGASLTQAAGTVWSTSASATPIANVKAAALKVYGNSGLWPNAVIMNRKTFKNCIDCAEVIDRIEASGAGQAAKASDVTPQLLAQVFDVDMVLVAGSSKNTAKEGQTASLSQIWSDSYVSVARIPTSNDIREPGLGRTFHWGEDGSQIGGLVESYRDEPKRSDIIRVRNDTHEKVLMSQAAVLITGVSS